MVVTLLIHLVVGAIVLSDWYRTARREPQRTIVTLRAQELSPEPRTPAPAMPSAAQDTSVAPLMPAPAAPVTSRLPPPPASLSPPTTPAPQPHQVSTFEDGLPLVTAYRTALTRRLAEARAYPEAGRAEELRGSGTVVFRIARDGTLIDAHMEKSTGRAVLDEAALAQVRRAAPFPPIPPELPDTLTVVLPLEFLVAEPTPSGIGA